LNETLALSGTESLGSEKTREQNSATVASSAVRNPSLLSAANKSTIKSHLKMDKSIMPGPGYRLADTSPCVGWETQRDGLLIS